jgi:hypothetical protein
MSGTVLRALRRAPIILAAPAIVLASAAPAAACAGLVGENGTIRLTRTTTLAAYHDGVERYVTAFDFSGEGKQVGSIVPLPGVPTKVERGGDWTLQRLEREVTPLDFTRKAAFAEDAAAPAGAQVLLQTTVDALDITILKGGGAEVGKWATDHGFLLSPDAPEVLDFYSRRSPIFMAARFDASKAAQLGQNAGDGTPLMLTIPTKEPWVPLRILSLGLDKSAVVDADVFLLTDTQPKLLAGGPGLQLDRNEPANALLLSDLRRDKHMEWVPEHMWFTYLHLNVTAGKLDYDLAISAHPHAVPDLAATGVTAAQAKPIGPSSPSSSRALWPIAAALGVGAGVFAVAGRVGRKRAPSVGAAA